MKNTPASNPRAATTVATPRRARNTPSGSNRRIDASSATSATPAIAAAEALGREIRARRGAARSLLARTRGPTGRRGRVAAARRPTSIGNGAVLGMVVDGSPEMRVGRSSDRCSSSQTAATPGSGKRSHCAAALVVLSCAAGLGLARSGLTARIRWYRWRHPGTARHSVRELNALRSLAALEKDS